MAGLGSVEPALEAWPRYMPCWVGGRRLRTGRGSPAAGARHAEPHHLPTATQLFGHVYMRWRAWSLCSPSA